MATTFEWYAQAEKLLATGVVVLGSDTVKLALVTSSYTFSSAHTQWADASGNEVAGGDGYTAGGAAIGSVAVTNGAITGNSVSWTALTKTFRRAIAYANVTRGGFTNPLIFSLLLDSTPADIVVSGINYQIRWNASGIASITLS